MLQRVWNPINVLLVIRQEKFNAMTLLSTILRYNFWIKDFLKGDKVWTHYCDIRYLQKKSQLAITQREQMLSELLHYATNNTKFYKNINSSDLKNFPVVNKGLLKKHYDEILIPEDANPWQRGGKYHIQKTSGSTGTPFAVPFDTRKRKRRLAELKYFGRIVGFRSHDKLVQLRIWTKWQNKSRSQSFWENIVPFDISNLNDTNLQLLCDTINKTKALCLRGYASSFDLLARYVGEHQLKLPSVKIIIAGSETLFDSTRTLVEKNIGCNIISQYANEENGILAQERVGDLEHRFYLNEADYFFEVLKCDSDEPAEYGELGRLVITDLFNYAFPIIRYDNGDNCIMELDEATNTPYISKLFGRRLDLIYNNQGEPVFPMILARVLKNYSEIRQWQFFQMNMNEYILKLVSNKDKIQLMEENNILNQLKETFGNDSKIQIEYVDEIPVLNSGKRKSVVNLWKQVK